MIKASELVSLLKKEVGTREISKNQVKYNTDYYGGVVNGSQYAWCVTFIWWGFKELGALNQFCDSVKTAYVPYVVSWGQRKGKIVDKNNIRKGDLVIMDLYVNGSTMDHIGVATDASKGSYITTIEGNVDNGVYIKNRKLQDVTYVVRPDYAPEEIIPEPTPSPSDVYIVKENDTLTGIAAKLGIDYKKLIAMNSHIEDKDLIFIGDRINISTSSTMYLVQKGDTLSGIAEMNNTTIGDLAERNNIKNINEIFAGEYLLIN